MNRSEINQSIKRSLKVGHSHLTIVRRLRERGSQLELGVLVEMVKAVDAELADTPDLQAKLSDIRSQIAALEFIKWGIERQIEQEAQS